MDHAPAKTTFVVVEDVEQGDSLEEFEHPKNATYIFGREAQGISSEHLGGNPHTVHCRLVKINTKKSLNLGVCASIVMYDRHTKIWQA